MATFVTAARSASRVSSGLLCVLIVLTAGFAAGVAAADQRPAYVEGEVLVKLRGQAGIGALPLAVKATQLASVTRAVSLVKLMPGVSVEDAVDELRRQPEVEYAEPNFIVRKAALPNDPRFNEQWALTKIAATSAWDQQTGSSSVIVAVLDTGIDYTHPDLAANMWQNPGESGGVAGVDDDGNGIVDDIYGASYNGTAVSGNPLDDDTADSHGTHVSGIVGAVGNNALGVAGINWSTQLMAVKFLHGPTGMGTISDAIKGVDYAIANGARLINMSFEVIGQSRFLEDALNQADAAGVLVVSAAGNGIEPAGGGVPEAANLDAGDVFVSPASIKTANNITVASSTSSDALWSESNYGAATVDVAAPGGSYFSGVLSTRLGGTYLNLAGTSMATPHVSGIAALVWSQYPSLSHYEVKARILNSVDPSAEFTDSTISGGRVNAYNALVNAALPAVFKVTPATVRRGGTVTVTGANFGPTAGTIMVGSTSLTVVSWDSSGERVVATVPSAAVTGRVQVNGEGISFPIVVKPQSSGDDGRCFIATAAYGSPLHPKVALLRRFRDKYLLTNAMGRFLVEAYYRLSPPLAGLIRESPRLKQAAVWALTPVVAGAEWLLAMSDQPPDDELSNMEEREVLVRFKPSVPEARRLEIIHEVDAELVEVQTQAGIYLLRMHGGQTAEAVIQRFATMDEVEIAEQNWRVTKPR